MTKIKMCGIRRREDIEFANALLPEYIGYVFAKKSRRYISPRDASELTKRLDGRIIPVGVFVNEPVENVISAVRSGIIKIAQLHGSEDEAYINHLHSEGITVIKAFIVKSAEDIAAAESSAADFILLDAGMGDGKKFDHELLKGISRQYFLAGGLTPENAADAARVKPYCLDVSSGIETDGFKDFEKMDGFTRAVRNMKG
ncbi:MAG: phosphoribosylanthranilate isomerase [Ruminococcus sp.]|nr:phosphoribosylanthranilate isomerase [Ruminococcus sp.]